jgi:hypothetical protein
MYRGKDLFKFFSRVFNHNHNHNHNHDLITYWRLRR